MNKTKAKAPETVTLTIESLSHDGRGIAYHHGKITFVSGALASEQVLCKITKKHSRYNEAVMINVLTAASDRTAPHCEHFGVCGGCSMQHMHVDTQIQFKQKTLLEQLKHFGKVVPEKVLTPITGEPWGYRRKARLGVWFAKEKNYLQLGFREKSSRFLTNIHACPILHNSIGTKISELRELIASLTQYQHIPQIEIAVSDQETVLIIRHLMPLPADDIAKICAFAQAHGFHIYLQPNPPEKTHRIWPQQLAEKLIYTLPDYQLAMQFDPLDFIQVNSEVNHLLIKQALQLLDPQPADTVLDLFCGLGNFTLPIARFAHHVTGIEGSQEMVKRAEDNARLNQITNTNFFAANLMEPTSSAAWMKQKYTKILLDPPRTGAKEIMPFIPNFSAKRIVYVSCNPATLARDAGELVYTHKYKLKQIGVVNMFPQTSHIEAIALFEK